MSKPLQQRFLATKQVASTSSVITTTQPAVQVISDGLPVGDEAIYGLTLRSRGNLNLTTSSAGTAITDDVFINLRNLTIETDKHNILVDNIDGLSLKRLNQLDWKTLPDSLSVTTMTTGTPAFDATWQIPFAWKDFVRPYDTLLDMLKSRMTIKASFGTTADFVSGGTYTDLEIQNLNLDVSGGIIRNPNPVSGQINGVNVEGELPILQRSIEVRKFDVNQTSTGVKFPLPFGDRIYRRIMVHQRNGSSLAELATVITATQNVGIEINGFPWIQTLPFGLINAQNKQEFEMETLPTSLCVFDFGKEGRIGDMLNTLSQDQGTMNLVADVTSVSNGQLWVVLDALKPIPPAARR